MKESSSTAEKPKLRKYAVFLRGVSPMNLKMADLKRCLERSGLRNVETVLSSGNAVFSTEPTPEAKLQRMLEESMRQHLGRSFLSFVWSIEKLQKLLESDPFERFRIPVGSKPVVTFLVSTPKQKPKLPVVFEDARMIAIEGRTAFSAYTPGPNGPVFMQLIEKTLGKEVTTRTWNTVAKVAKK